MGEKISDECIFNAAVQLYLAFDERMGRVQPKGILDRTPKTRDEWAFIIAGDFAKFYQTFANELASQLQLEKPN